jgi:polyhydroxyalkanoate synthesis regulator phasin
MTTFEEMPSVKTAVDREAQRRKRVFATFLSLLIIPIAIGAYAIARAPSETDAVVTKVTPLVQERVDKNVEKTITARVDRTVEPRVVEIVERKATPVIERTLNKQVNAAVTARIQPLEQNYRVLTARNTEHDKTTARVQELEKRVALLERQIAALTNQRNPKLDPAIKVDPTRRVPKPQ